MTLSCLGVNQRTVNLRIHLRTRGRGDRLRTRGIAGPFPAGGGGVSDGNAAPLRVQLLGPVRAWRGDEELALGGPRRRAVLAMLAMNAQRVVSRSELIDGLWDHDPPASAVNSVHVYVAGLRHVLEPRRAHRAPGQVLAASGPGYRLRLEPGQLDAEVLDHHLTQARKLPADAGAERARARARTRTPRPPLGRWTRLWDYGRVPRWPGFPDRGPKSNGYDWTSCARPRSRTASMSCSRWAAITRPWRSLPR